MNKVSALLDNMLSGLQTIVSSNDNPVKNYIQSIEIIAQSIAELESYLTEHVFTDTDEEIDFFKNVRPQFDGRLIFYLRLVDLEARVPDGGLDKLRFLRRELRRIKLFYRVNKDFYRYMLTGATHLDQFYFLRSDKPDPAHMDDFYHAYNPRFHTRMSSKAARLRACKLLSDFIKDAMLDLTGEQRSEVDVGGSLIWRAPKVYLAELIYGLHAMGVFGNVDLQRIVKVVTGAFNAQFANPYKVFEEIRLRKKNRTSFLDSMRLNLLRRMEHDDEFSL